MANSLSAMLMFEGAAEEAMTLYTSLFPGSKITHIERYGAEGPGAAGTVKYAEFTVAGYSLLAIDSPAKHAFTFTPSISLFVNCSDETELMAAYGQLVERGGILMPIGNYGFSQKFCWINDRYGVSWQLNLK
jgi:predicted 3-demethylubiquinone-9 3-methyltransferase (glyoxalase superfamily)